MSFTEALTEATKATCTVHEQLIAQFEKEKSEFAQYRDETIAGIGTERAALDQRKTDLDVRESTVAQREANVSNILGIAANRKTQIDTLKENQDEILAQKTEANTKAKAAIGEAKKLKETLATTLADNVTKDKRIAELELLLDQKQSCIV